MAMRVLRWEHGDGSVGQTSQISTGQSLSLRILCYHFHHAISRASCQQYFGPILMIGVYHLVMFVMLAIVSFLLYVTAHVR